MSERYFAPSPPLPSAADSPAWPAGASCVGARSSSVPMPGRLVWRMDCLLVKVGCEWNLRCER